MCCQMATRLTPSFVASAAPDTQPGSRARSSRRITCSAVDMRSSRRVSADCGVEMKDRGHTLAQMSFADLQSSIASDAAPANEWSGALQALWHDARGDWQ